ncbi:MAG: hypothetical protein ACKVJE_22820, partial [Pseudomonadales bacterium]
VPTTVDLDARILESKIAYEGKAPDTLFGGHTILHKVDAKYQGKPPTPKDVEAALNKALKDSTPQEITDAILLAKSLDTAYETALKARVTKTELAAEKLVSSKDDDKKLKADGAFESANKALADYIATRETITRMAGVFAVGNHIRLKLGDETVTGVVIGLRDSHKKGKGSPYALSKMRVSFMVNNGIRQIDLPFSRLGDPEIFIERLTNKGITGLDDVFSVDLAGHERREARYVATHNLIAGSAKLYGGRITTFTDNKGETHQGILMPRSYGDEQYESVGTSQNFALRDNAVLVKYLKSNMDKLEGKGVANINGTVRLQPDGRGDWKITIPKSNKDANARNVKFDESLRKAMGTDFYGKSKDMTATFPASKLAKVIPVLNELSLMYGLPSYRDAWVAAGGNKSAEAVNSFSSDVVETKEQTKDDNDGVSFSQSSGTGKGSDQSFIKRLVDKQVLSWPSAPPVIVVQSISGLPEYIQEAIRVRNGVNVSGVRDQRSGNIYLVADNLPNGLKAKKVLAHEAVGHYAMEQMLGDEFAKVVDRVQQLKGRDKTIQQLASQVKGEGSAYIESAEIVAKMAEEGIKHPVLVKAYAAIRNFLRRLGFSIEFGLADLKGMLVDAALWLRKPVKYSGKSADAGIYSQAAFSQDSPDGRLINNLEQYGTDVADSIKSVWKKKWTADLRPAWLALLTRRHLADIASGVLPQIKQYVTIAQHMDARRNDLLTEGADIADKWARFNIKHRAEGQELADLMHSATIAGVDPSKKYTPIITEEEAQEIKAKATRMIKDRSNDGAGGGSKYKDGVNKFKSAAQWREEIKDTDMKLAQERNRKKARAELEARWMQLSPEARIIYKDVRDLYKSRQRETLSALEARIGRTITDGKSAQALIS